MIYSTAMLISDIFDSMIYCCPLFSSLLLEHEACWRHQTEKGRSRHLGCVQLIVMSVAHSYWA